MASVPDYHDRLPGAFRTPGVSSFATFLNMTAPHLLPDVRQLGGGAPMSDIAPHGTTIVAATCADGVVMAGDRRATMGNMISMRDMEKVFPADAWSMVGIAGTAGLATELVRLYQVELEHYEKLEGVPLSLKGKAHRLASMIRGNLGMAMQGLAVVPLFAGYDPEETPATNGGRTTPKKGTKKRSPRGGRIFSYDVTGSMHEETSYQAVGSGSIFAKSALKKRYVAGAPANDVVRMCVEALYDAADEDSATGGPDVARGLYPTVLIANADGVRRVPEAELEATATAVIEARKSNPGG